jgi:hypothetical protein
MTLNKNVMKLIRRLPLPTTITCNSSANLFAMMASSKNANGIDMQWLYDLVKYTSALSHSLMAIKIWPLSYNFGARVELKCYFCCIGEIIWTSHEA